MLCKKNEYRKNFEIDEMLALKVKQNHLTSFQYVCLVFLSSIN